MESVPLTGLDDDDDDDKGLHVSINTCLGLGAVFEVLKTNIHTLYILFEV